MAGQLAVIGTGVIGASWAALFLAHGHDVAAADPAPDAEAALRRGVAQAWPVLARMGLAEDASPERLRFHASAEAAVEGAAFVQENGPERLDLKQALMRRLDDATPSGVVIASSSSTLSVTAMQGACTAEPGRVVLGHPFNPPHLIPLVEVVGGQSTSEAAVAAAMAFYRRLGRHPIRLRREITGHVANRLQAALWQEAFHLVREGVADVADVDAAIAHGPGLRWALLGPFLNLHLSGGAGGLAGLMQKPLWQATEGMYGELGTVASSAGALAGTVVAGVEQELAGCDLDALVQRRDEALAALIALKRASGGLP